MHAMIASTPPPLPQVSSTSSGNLLENFVTAAHAHATAATGTHASITDAAILGNLFIFTLAGHETSANTLTFAFSLLATHPTFRSQLQQELDLVLE
jgi:cytochrome P450